MGPDRQQAASNNKSPSLTDQGAPGAELRYVSHGPRRFDLKPFGPMRRPYWEFFAIVEGEVAPIGDLRERPKFRGRTLWLFSPQHLHGWRGAPRRRCRVAVFHFDQVPPALQRGVEAGGFLAVPLTARDCRLVDGWARELMPFSWASSELKDILAEKVRLDLTLIFLRKTRTANKADQSAAAAAAKVEAAEGRFLAQLSQSPPLSHLATAAGVSEAHLRRLFWQVRKKSPRAVMQQIRMDAALRLLAGTDQKLQTIALDCGYKTASNLCQAFKSATGITPAVWRAQRAREAARTRHFRGKRAAQATVSESNIGAP